MSVTLVAPAGITGTACVGTSAYAIQPDGSLVVANADAPPLIAQGFTYLSQNSGQAPTRLNVVRVNAGGTGGAQASPYTVKPYDYCILDTSGGNAVANVGKLALNQFCTVKHDANTSLASNTATINGVGANLEQPLGPPGGSVAPGTFAGAGAVLLNAAAQQGSSYSWANTGSAGGYTLV